MSLPRVAISATISVTAFSEQENTVPSWFKKLPKRHLWKNFFNDNEYAFLGTGTGSQITYISHTVLSKVIVVLLLYKCDFSIPPPHLFHLFSLNQCFGFWKGFGGAWLKKGWFLKVLNTILWYYWTFYSLIRIFADPDLGSGKNLLSDQHSKHCFKSLNQCWGDWAGWAEIICFINIY